jgi:hypothetical protein
LMEKEEKELPLSASRYDEKGERQRLRIVAHSESQLTMMLHLVIYYKAVL